MPQSPYLSLIEKTQFFTIIETIQAMHGNVYDLLEDAQLPDELFDFEGEGYLLTNRVVAFFQLLEQRFDSTTLIKIIQISAQKNALQLIQQLPINNDITLQQALQLFFDYNFRSSPNSNFFIKKLFNRYFFCRDTLFIDQQVMPIMELYLIAVFEALVSALCNVTWHCKAILLQSEQFSLCQKMLKNKQLQIFSQQKYTAIELSNEDLLHPVTVNVGKQIQKVSSMKLRTVSGALNYALPLYLSMGRPNIEFAAQLCGLSTSTLKRRLSEEGTTYSELLDKLIIELAQQHLQSKQFSITEIALALGYPYPNHFTRMFKKQVGCSPKQYRQKS